MDLGQQRGEPGPPQLAVGRWPPAPVGVAAAVDADDAAGLPLAESLPGQALDYREEPFGWTFSCSSKIFAASRTRSSSCSSSRIRFLAAASSMFSALVVPGTSP